MTLKIVRVIIYSLLAFISVLPGISYAKSNGTVQGDMNLFLYKSGTGSERSGTSAIYASLGDTISIDAFVTNYSQVPVSAIELYFTVDDRYFDIVSQGVNSDKTSKYYGQPKPFIKGMFFINASGSIAPYGNNTYGDTLSAADNNLEGWQLNYVEITPPDNGTGSGRPVSRLRYGVVATFKLICKAPCDSVPIQNDFDTFHLRLTRYFDPTSPNNYSFADYKSCYITVSGVSINPPLPDIHMQPASADSSLDLDEHIGLSSIPDSLFEWKATGNNRIGVTINPKTHVATFTSPANFHGYEDVVFSVGSSKDPSLGTSDTLRVFVNIPPVLKRDALPDTIYIHEDSLEVALLLPDIVEDPDNNFQDLSWTFATGPKITWMNFGAKQDTLKLMGVLNFNGIEHLDITVADDYGLKDSIRGIPVVVIPVNDPPYFSGLTDISFERSRPYILNIANYSGDVDGDPLVVNYDTPQNFTIQINGMVATIREKTGFLGSERLRFIVTDPSGLSAADSMLVTVTPLSNPPVWSKIPKIGFPQNQTFSDLILWDYVSDPDGEDTQLKFTFSNYDDVDSIYVSPQNGRLYLYDLDNKPGWDMVTVTATDLDGHSVSAQFLVFIGPSDGTPIVAAIPDTSMRAGSSLNWIDLDDYYYDVDNSDSEMKWTVAHAVSDSIVKVNIHPLFHNVTLVSERVDLYGTDTLIFTVSDPGGKSANDDCKIIVIGKSDPVLDLPNKIGFVTGNKAVIDLNDYAFDPQFTNADLNWSWSGNTNILIDFEEQYLQYIKPLYLTAPNGWTGWEEVKFSVENPFAGNDIDSIRVYSVPADGTPVVGGLDNVFVRAGYCDSLNIDLDDYFFDADTPDWNMTWSVSGNDSVQVTIDPITHRMILCSPSTTYEGQEIITVTASDGLHQASMDVRVNVYGAVLKGVFSMQLYRNPMQNDYMDIYIKCRDRLKSIPSLRVEVASESKAVNMRGVSDSLNYYFGQYILPYESSLGLQRDAIVIASGETTAGKAVQDTLTFTYGRLGPGGGKLALGEASFDIPVKAIDKPSTITIIRNQIEISAEKNTIAGNELIFKGDSYILGPVDMIFKVPIKVEFEICCRTDGAGIYKSGKSGWEYIGGSVKNGKINGETVTGGIYALGYDYTPPQISVIEGKSGSQTIRISDYGSGVDKSSISVSSNGNKLNYTYYPETDTYEIEMDGIFDKSDILLEISVSDKAGNFIRKAVNGTAEPNPGQFIVEQNIPNPFNPRTSIIFSISGPEMVKVEIFDILGRRIRLLTDSRYSSGRHILEWDASDDSGRTVSSGIYLYRVSGNTKVITKKMLFMR